MFTLGLKAGSALVKEKLPVLFLVPSLVIKPPIKRADVLFRIIHPELLLPTNSIVSLLICGTAHGLYG